jgi:hypothetical protein
MISDTPIHGKFISFIGSCAAFYRITRQNSTFPARESALKRIQKGFAIPHRPCYRIPREWKKRRNFIFFM